MREIIKDPISAALTEEHAEVMSQLKGAARARYGENRKITDGNYSESLAARCVNGTFVGRKVADMLSAAKLLPNCGRWMLRSL